MSLIGSLYVGRTGILASQAAIQVTGNNLTNASSTGYTRQRVELSALYGASEYGNGVQVNNVSRIVDDALTQRLREANSNTNYDKTRSDYLTQLEKIYNELSDGDLSTGLDDFFGSFSTLASDPSDSTSRNNVINEGKTLVNQIQTLRSEILDLNTTLGKTMTDSVDGINTITDQLAKLNVEIANATSTGDSASALQDQRDSLLSDLSNQVKVNVINQDDGSVLVYLGSQPLVQDNQARELQVTTESKDGEAYSKISFADNGQNADIEGGTVGAINDLINNDVYGNISDLDTMTSALIFEVNKIHSSGQGTEGYTTISSTNTIKDATASLNQAGLPFTPQNGSFKLTVTDSSTTPPTSNVTQINVDLNGLNSETSLNDLADQLDAIDHISASVTTDGKLNITSDSSHYSFTFSDDTSNVLTCLGLNGFFTGKDSGDIGLNTDVVNNPNLLACSQSGTGTTGNGTNAEAIGNLTTTASSMLNDQSITAYYNSIAGGLGSELSSANQQYDIHSTISDSLQSQWDSLSGVNIDEETINLMSYQRGFQGAAKFISTIDQLLDNLMSIF